MALDQSALLEVLDALEGRGVDDRIRQAAQTIYQALIEAELTAVIGAGPHQRTQARLGQGNGHRPRVLSTTAGAAVDSMGLHRTLALLALASVRHGQGDLPGARALADQARELVNQSTDPGVLSSLLEQTEEALGWRPHRPGRLAAPLTERELAVLRLLPTRLSTREISRQLAVSPNTVRSHVQAIYRKLQVNSRAEAVTTARQLGLVPTT